VTEPATPGWLSASTLEGPSAALRNLAVEPSASDPPGVRLVRRHSKRYEAETCHLAIRAAGRWFVAREPIGRCDDQLGLPAIEIVAADKRKVVPGDGAALVLDVVIRTSRPSPGRYGSYDADCETEAIFLCAMHGAQPRCTPPIPVANKCRRASRPTPGNIGATGATGDARDLLEADWRVDIALPGDGTIVITGEVSGFAQGNPPLGTWHLDL
jgi:hypothetical protein